MARPAALSPSFASSPASTTVTKAGPSSGRASSTTVVSSVWTSQSQVWPASTGPPVRLGSAANDVHSSGSGSAAPRAVAANMISVRTLMASTSSSGTPAPSAIPASSSR